jgi:hypothetical protein
MAEGAQFLPAFFFPLSKIRRLERAREVYIPRLLTDSVQPIAVIFLFLVVSMMFVSLQLLQSYF